MNGIFSAVVNLCTSLGLAADLIKDTICEVTNNFSHTAKKRLMEVVEVFTGCIASFTIVYKFTGWEWASRTVTGLDAFPLVFLIAVGFIKELSNGKRGANVFPDVVALNGR